MRMTATSLTTSRMSTWAWESVAPAWVAPSNSVWMGGTVDGGVLVEGGLHHSTVAFRAAVHIQLVHTKNFLIVLNFGSAHVGVPPFLRWVLYYIPGPDGPGQTRDSVTALPPSRTAGDGCYATGHRGRCPGWGNRWAADRWAGSAPAARRLWPLPARQSRAPTPS